jgi:hypothetical protein
MFIYSIKNKRLNIVQQTICPLVGFAVAKTSLKGQTGDSHVRYEILKPKNKIRIMKKITLILVFISLKLYCIAGWLTNSETALNLSSDKKMFFYCYNTLSGGKLVNSIDLELFYKNLEDKEFISVKLLSWQREINDTSSNKYGFNDIPVLSTMSMDNKTIALVTSNKYIYIIDINKKTVYLDSLDKSKTIEDIAFSNEHLNIGLSNGHLLSYQIKKNKFILVNDLKITDCPLKSIKYSLKSKKIIISSENANIFIYDEGKPANILKFKGFPLIDLSVDQNLFIAASNDSVAYYDFKGKQLNGTFVLSGSKPITKIVYINQGYFAYETTELNSEVTITKFFHLTNNELLESFNSKLVGYDPDLNSLILGKEPSIVNISFANQPNLHLNPEIYIKSPTLKVDTTFNTSEKIIIIKGSVKSNNQISQILINDKLTPFISSNGEFMNMIELDSGYNEITIKAFDTYNNISQKQYNVLYKPLNRNVQSLSENDETINKTFTYHALIIANQNYSYVQSLTYPILDAKNFQNILIENYTFESTNITLIQNANRKTIIQSLDSLLNILSKNDLLLIFYAGHGYFDNKLNQGYWIPVDASIDNRANWLSNSDLRDYIAAIGSQHVLLIADACFSGSIFENNRSILSEKGYNNLNDRKSRCALTSGMKETVPDKSLFIDYLLKCLLSNQNKYLRASEIFQYLQEPVLSNTNNAPQFGVIKNTNHEGGEFIFIRK